MRNKVLTYLLASTLLLLCEIANIPCCAQAVQYVDTFLGVDNTGNTFPGASLPFSMVKPGADVLMPARWTNNNSGYATNRPVCGYSINHVSGTGGAAKYGNFRVMPTTGSVNLRDMSAEVIDESSRPGYYATTLSNGVRTELTLTHSVGFYRFTVVNDADSLRLLIDASSLLDKGSTPQHLLTSGIELISDNEIVGYCKSEGGWNTGECEVYFYAQINHTPSAWGTFRQGRMSRSNRSEKSINGNDNTEKALYVSFPAATPTPLEMRMALSFVSAQKAKENYLAEAATLTFDDAIRRAGEEWNTYLERIDIEATQEVKTMFYSALYRALLMPTKRTGEMKGWNSKEVYYDDYYAIWDTFRTTAPLITLIAPEKIAEQIESLINIGTHEGWMPDARSGNKSGLVQGGTNCDVMIADACMKGIEGIDYEKALELMLHAANTEPDKPRLYGRGGISHYNTVGYIPHTIERSGSRQVEYAYCDYAIAKVAEQLGQHEIATEYFERSSRWMNLWNSTAEHDGFSGFVWPKDENGEWLGDYNPLKLSVWNGVFYEGSSWQYSLYVPHDVAKLIEMCGGKERFVERLDHFFEQGMSEGELRRGLKGYYNVGNEPSFLTPTLYTWAGRYDLTAKRTREIIDTYFSTGRSGLPGNDDSAATGSWCAFHLLGLYPNAGQDYYLLSSPQIESATLHLSNGKEFNIIVKNGTKENIYIRSAKLNGRPYNKAWITHRDIVAGGRLELTMGSKPSRWGKTELPPSLSDKK
ncbi:MAG: GH92 family glycosyl hydrolase [Tidjanibacter sp.]|nr:GH92 family glycosyl hydrolase [Tidjanibacter sp.]